MSPKNAPAKVRRTGKSQLSVTLDDADCEFLEAYRAEYGLRSWGAAVRRLTVEAIATELKSQSPITVHDIYAVDRSAVERQLGCPIKTLAPWERRPTKGAR